MILKIQDQSGPFGWFVMEGVKEYEYREVSVTEASPRPSDYVNRDFLPAEGTDANMNPHGAGYIAWLVSANATDSGVSLNPSAVVCSWTCLARLGTVYVMSDNGKTIDKF